MPVLLAGPLALSCTIPDDERCPSGYAYNDKTHTCASMDCDTGELWNEKELKCVASDTDTGTDGSDSSSRADIGEECSEDGQCQSDYCALHPLKPDDPGYCTSENCAKGKCPSGFECCDCSALGKKEPFCAKTANVAEAESVGCECS